MSNTILISLCFGSANYQVGELSSYGGRSILAIQSLPFPIPGVAVGTSQFLDNAPLSGLVMCSQTHGAKW